MSRTGTLRRDGDRWELRFERELAHPVETVWRAVFDSDRLAHWYPAAERELEPVVGGKVREVYGAGEQAVTIHGVVTALEPPHVLEYRMDSSAVGLAGFDEIRTLRFELHPLPTGCRLVFLHTFGDRPGAASFATGWHRCLDALADSRTDAPTSADPDFSWPQQHERYVRQFGLDEGTAEQTDTATIIRFERQLMMHPVDEVWQALTAGHTPTAGAEPPAPFAPAGLPTGPARTVDPPSLLEFHTATTNPHTIRWQLRPGPGGARITLTDTAPQLTPEETAEALATWHDHIEQIVADLGRQD
ncbi:SRPBCC family protein [Nocardia terpenica]|uniref:Activator of Hsp90 ATPase homologue 1/2-like C-terminal domain-containing protein n=1 Tax=Nocardia terpenica TaxID=455432 RepID=A0A164MNU9_9NOCA|nr:SRPBCC family protein [Nocardia terpenica]KZM73526.1 hypothetical protein AWN90_33450 [Nocardia terpenica]NQE87278.1 toxin-antitoxin system toxin subunit [Nocardia terpenica]